MAFSTNFCNIETDMSGYTVWPQALYSFKESPKTIFGIFLWTQNVYVVRTVEWDFFYDFHTLWIGKNGELIMELPSSKNPILTDEEDNSEPKN